MTRPSTAPLALVTAAITIAPPALAQPIESTSEAAYAAVLGSVPPAPALPTATESHATEWSCVASARLRNQFVGTAWSERASTREAAATDALQRCSQRAGSRTCEIRRCWTTPAK